MRVKSWGRTIIVSMGLFSRQEEQHDTREAVLY